MVALTIIYLGFLNPDLYLSDNGPTFNTRSLRMVLNELPRLQYKHLLGFSLRNYNHERSILGSRQMDAVIQLVSMYLKQEFPQEVPFYLRGGRFALIGPDPHTEIELSKRILARFQKPWRVGNAYFSMSASFVYVDEASEALDTDRALNDLIIALDNARLNPVPTSDDIVATPLDMQEIDRQVNMLRTLERALESESVEVFFQPLVNSQTLVIEGAEALARIRDEQGQIVPPGKFIAIAERSGLIIELGEQVLKKTCEFVVSHDLDALGISWININLSPVQCMQQGIDDHFTEILEEYGIDPSVIHLEITEQSMVDYALLQQQISTLEKLGFVFVLDDYGSGYSNLARVKQYPFSTIKLDMGVVWDYYRDKDDLLPSIVRGFKSVGLSITAEGIETKEMAEALTSIGSDYLQGYYFSRPLPVPEFLQFLSPQPR
jgi:EAL domain-containing protein (putative c-di-GMP-specific phosphodiesterase class I)